MLSSRKPNPSILSCGIPTLTLHPSYVPYTDDKSDITACGIPVNYDASKEWADKKVILFAVPGQSRHTVQAVTVRRLC